MSARADSVGVDFEQAVFIAGKNCQRIGHDCSPRRRRFDPNDHDADTNRGCAAPIDWGDRHNHGALVLTCQAPTRDGGDARSSSR